MNTMRWYDHERAGLGAEFQDELWRALELLLQAPEMGPIAHRDLRRLLLRRFPYAVYYRVNEPVIEVRACLHVRQHQSSKLRRA